VLLDPDRAVRRLDDAEHTERGHGLDPARAAGAHAAALCATKSARRCAADCAQGASAATHRSRCTTSVAVTPTDSLARSTSDACTCVSSDAGIDVATRTTFICTSCAGKPARSSQVSARHATKVAFRASGAHRAALVTAVRSADLCPADASGVTRARRAAFGCTSGSAGRDVEPTTVVTTFRVLRPQGRA